MGMDMGETHSRVVDDLIRCRIYDAFDTGCEECLPEDVRDAFAAFWLTADETASKAAYDYADAWSKQHDKENIAFQRATGRPKPPRSG
jgi:hypothetical protein